MWKKLDVSENLSDGEQKSFSETKKRCQVSRAKKIFFGGPIKKSALICNILLTIKASEHLLQKQMF